MPQGPLGIAVHLRPGCAQILRNILDLFFTLCVVMFCLHVCMDVCMDMYHMHVWCLQKSGMDLGSPENGITDGCKPPCECEEWNRGHL